MNEPHQSDGSRIIDLSRVGIPRLLFSLLSQRFTGRVELGQPPPDEGHRIVSFRGGLPRICRWHVEGTRVGELLVEQGSLEQSALDAVLADPEEGKLLGRQLIDAQLVSLDDVALALRSQCEQRLVELCSAHEGEALVAPSEGEEDDEYPDARTLWVLVRGVRRHFSPDRIEKELGDKLAQPFRTIDAFERYRPQFEFDAAEAQALALMARPEGASAQMLVAEGQLDPVRAKQLVYVLGVCKMLGAPKRTASQESEPASTAPEDSDAAISMVSAVMPVGSLRSSADALARARTLNRYVAQGSPDHLVFGIDENADLRTIEKAARRLLDVLRPEGVEGKDAQQEVRQAERAVDRMRQTLRSKRAKQVDERAATTLEKGDWTAALPLFEDRLQLEPNDPPTRAVLAWLRFQGSTRTPREAQRGIDALGRIIDQHPGLLEARYYKALLLLERSETRRALEAFDRVLEIDPEHADARAHAERLRGDAKAGADPKPSRSEAKRHRAEPVPELRPKKRSSQHPLWSGPWPTIWVGTGIVLFVLVVAQIVLRLDFDF